MLTDQPDVADIHLFVPDTNIFAQTPGFVLRTPNRLDVETTNP